jgi:predicted nucleic acid-binding protein
VDTSAYFAFIAPRDTNHEQAISISRVLANQSWRLFTSNYIVAETHALLLARLGRATAFTFLQEIDRSTTQLVRATHADERRAREIIERYTDKDFSLADAISFSMMERLNIRSAFTFDQHFAQYGFMPLTSEFA